MLFSWIWLLKKRGKNTIIKIKYPYEKSSSLIWNNNDNKKNTNGCADLPESEDILMIIPWLWFVEIISGMKWRIIFAIPFRLVSITLSNSSTSNSHIFPFLFIKPALFTITPHTHTHTQYPLSFLFHKQISYVYKQTQNKVEYIPMMFGTNSFSTVAPANSSTLLFDLCIIQLLLDLKGYIINIKIGT